MSDPPPRRTFATVMGRRYRSKYKDFDAVEITGIADRGTVVGRSAEGEVVFARGPVPGDVVDLTARRKKGVYQEGVARGYRRFAEGRTPPFCRHFGACGGCAYQHMAYGLQLEAKTQLVADAYRRIGGLDLGLEPILAAPSERGYRNKMEYAFADRRWLTEEEVALGHATEGAALGFHRRGAWDKVLDIRRCHLQDERGDRLRNTLREVGLAQGLTFYNERTHEGFLRKAMLRVLDGGEVMLLLMFGAEDAAAARAYVDAVLARCAFVTTVYTVVNDKLNDSLSGLSPKLDHGPPHVTEAFGHVRFRIGPLSFFQTNTAQAIRLYDVVAAYAGLDGTQNVYDLYAGVGSIGLYLARRARQVVAIEEVAAAIEDAGENARLNGISNFVGYAGDVGAVLTAAFAKTHGPPDVVVTDPPRAGMHADVVAMLLRLGAPRIVYVSCNPATQARDLRLLVEGGYRVTRARPVDMFPQTPHCEAVAVLERSPALGLAGGESE